VSKQNKIKHRFGDEKGAMHSRKEGKRYQGCPALYSKPERRGILPVTVRGSATEKADFARKVWWYFKGVFGGIVGIDE
jgi:hypothetical protein